MTIRSESFCCLLLTLIVLLGIVLGCGTSETPAGERTAKSAPKGRIAGLLDSLHERVLEQPEDLDGYLKLARLLTTLRRFEDADRIIYAADSVGLAAPPLAGVRAANFLAWAENARDERDSTTFSRCLLRLMEAPLPDSLLPVIGRLVGISHPVRRVTDNLVADYAPKFFRHGQSLVYFSRLEREAEEYGGRYSVRYQTQICTVGIDGGEPTIISDGKASDFFPDISPDGRWVVCQRSDGDTLKAEWTAAHGSYLYLYDLQIGEGHRLGEDDLYGRCPRFTPSGKEVLFVSGSAGNQGWISTIDPATREITPRYRYSNLLRFNIPRLAFFPAMFPDEKRMVFQAGLWREKALFLADEFGREITRLTLRGSERQPSVAPDGESIVYVGENRGRTELFLYRLADHSREQITFDGSAKAFPSFSPDGRLIVFCAKRPDESDADYEIFILDLAFSAGRTVIETRVQQLAQAHGLLP